MKQTKHTSELIFDFQFYLQKRKKELYESLDGLDLQDNKQAIIYEFATNEIKRIDKLLKLTSKI